MRKIREQKAITLIALIITIVVLLILAVVPINSITNDGIISKAEQAANKYNESVQNETDILQGYLDYLEEIELNSKKFSKTGTINGEAYGPYNPAIPKGFAPIDTETSSWGATNLEAEVKKGLVISDGTSEFVWIPVSNINNMVMCQTHGATVVLDLNTLQCSTCGEDTKLAGKLYATATGESFDHDLTGQTYGKNTGLREPDVVTYASEEDSTAGGSYDAVEGNLSIVLEGEYENTKTAENFKLQLENEFTKMAKSVAKYKGFYVGRYETSLSSGIAQSKSEELPMNNINWYNMYKNSKTYSRNNTSLGVVSEMIWGCQWDQMMQLILTGPDASHVKAKKNVGHTSSDFTSKPYETGGTNYSEVYSGTTNEGKYGDTASNIYDLEGNVIEWTQEADLTYYRVLRGGSYGGSGSPSYRYHSFPTDSSAGYGSRLSLYVEL